MATKVTQITPPKYSKHPPRKHAPYILKRQVKSSSALRYFNQCPWNEWWHEFITSRTGKDGRMTYITAYQFAQAKGETSREVELIYRAIGPRPRNLAAVAKEGKWPGNKVPHLGDWQQLRAKAYFYDDESVDKMRVVIAQKLDGLEAGRGSATVVLDQIAKWVKYDQDLDDKMGSAIIDPLAPLSRIEKRADLFYKLKEKNLKNLLSLIDKYLACHGISTADGMNDLGQLVMAVSSSALKQGQVIERVTPALDMLSRAIMERSKTFNMALPAAVLAPQDADDGNETQERV